MPLLEFKKNGIYCPIADVYIDPWKSVPKALITHGHSDHARRGHEQYISTHGALPVIKHRLGKINIQGVDYGQTVMINGVKFSFHPAGHIPGSAQIRVEYRGEVWVASGDYKVEDDGLSEAFEPIKCHSFITESTFGLPIFNWQKQVDTFGEINDWWADNASKGIISVITAYSLGKAQRLIHNVDNIGRIYTHSAVENTNGILRTQGYDIPPTFLLDKSVTAEDAAGSLIIAPPSAIAAQGFERFQPRSVAFASGWMAVKKMRKSRGGSGQGFVLSDHADWKGLNSAIRETEAENIFVTHGYTGEFTAWLREEGYNAHVVSTEYKGDDLQMEEEAA